MQLRFMLAVAACCALSAVAFTSSGMAASKDKGGGPHTTAVVYDDFSSGNWRKGLHCIRRCNYLLLITTLYNVRCQPR